MMHKRPSTTADFHCGKPSAAHPANDAATMITSKMLKYLLAVFSDMHSFWGRTDDCQIAPPQNHVH